MKTIIIKVSALQVEESYLCIFKTVSPNPTIFSHYMIKLSFNYRDWSRRHVFPKDDDSSNGTTRYLYV